MGEDAIHGSNGERGGERKRANEDKRGKSVESPNGHPWSPRGDIRNVNRTNQSGDELAAKLSGRVRRFSHFTRGTCPARDRVSFRKILGEFVIREIDIMKNTM